ncbi:aldo/keto reductase [Mycoplasma sp. P36-A1]|uniref:aldo/keto reductase n=1 Tax=Mycoplasma sp. P36-A1 TaxID=3252900 RepID=UPI003C30E13A
MKNITLKNNMEIPRLGMGTWYLGEKASTCIQELEALREGIDLGITLIDTAELYGYGASEELIATAIKKYDRESLFIVDKVMPQNATRNKIFEHLNASLERLDVDYIDLYLLHWPTGNDLQEVVDCFEEMVKSKKIKSWGVSNFDTDDMKELLKCNNGNNCVVNQVLYNLGSRGIEYDLMPYLHKNNIALMAYSPLTQAGNYAKGILKNETLVTIAKKYNIKPIQLLLTFVMQNENIIAIPRSGKAQHIKELQEAANIKLKQEDYTALDKEFPAPDHKTELHIE